MALKFRKQRRCIYVSPILGHTYIQQRMYIYVYINTNNVLVVIIIRAIGGRIKIQNASSSGIRYFDEFADPMAHERNMDPTNCISTSQRYMKAHRAVNQAALELRSARIGKRSQITKIRIEKCYSCRQNGFHLESRSNEIPTRFLPFVYGTWKSELVDSEIDGGNISDEMRNACVSD